MFSEPAELYDLIYSSKDYRGEAAKIREVIARDCPAARKILDVACGTGEHAKLLAGDFAVDGIDIDSKSIAIARAKVPSGDFRVADMRSFQISSRYDVVQCLFSAIGYLTSPADVVSAFECFRRHLAPDGIVLVEPWLSPDEFQVGHLNMVVVDQPDMKVCRMTVSQREGDVSVMPLQYLIATKDGVRHLEETHRLALFSVKQLIGFFQAAGLEPTFDPVGLFGRGLFIARAVAGIPAPASS